MTLRIGQVVYRVERYLGLEPDKEEGKIAYIRTTEDARGKIVEYGFVENGWTNIKWSNGSNLYVDNKEAFTEYRKLYADAIRYAERKLETRRRRLQAMKSFAKLEISQ